LISGTISSIVAGAGNFLSTIGVMDGTYSSNVTLSWGITAPLLGLESNAAPAQMLAAPAGPAAASKSVGSPIWINETSYAVLGANGQVTIYTTNNTGAIVGLPNVLPALPGKETITAICVSPNGESIVVGTSDGKIYTYDIVKGKYLPGSTQVTSGAAITSIVPFGGNGLVVSTAWGGVYVRQPQSVSQPQSQDWDLLRTGPAPVLIGLVPDDTDRLVIVDGSTVYLYDLRTGKMISSVSNVPGGPFTSMTVVSVDGYLYIVLGGPKGFTQLYITAPGQRYPGGTGTPVLPEFPQNIIPNAAGGVIVAMPSNGPRKGNIIVANSTKDGTWTIVVRSSVTGVTLDILVTGLTPVTNMAVSPDGKWLVVTFANGSVRTYDLKTGKMVSETTP